MVIQIIRTVVVLNAFQFLLLFVFQCLQVLSLILHVSQFTLINLQWFDANTDLFALMSSPCSSINPSLPSLLPINSKTFNAIKKFLCVDIIIY